MKSKSKKICIVASSLGKGGAERSSALLSFMLFNLGYDIFIVTVLDDIKYAYKGKLFNLGALKKQNDSFFGRINRFKTFKQFLKANQIDVIIDNRSRVQAYREIILTKFIYSVPTIYVIHNFNSEKAFTKYGWINKWLYSNKFMTAVSKAATEKFKTDFDLHQIRTIYNGFDFEDIKTLANKTLDLEVPDKFVIFYGRIDDHHKNLKLLLEAYKLSDLCHHDYKLLILGDGPDYQEITSHVKSLHLEEHVLFKGFISNPYPYVSKAKYMVLSSRFEGFPMVIPEALGLGVPVVSVDCQSGPNEVIKNRYNGLLVENYNPNALAEAMNSFIFDDALYQECQQNAESSVQKLSKQIISKDWDNLLKEVL